ncbi:hypothetical protein, partial [Anaerostipes hadrus]|uniref:hypothetical protein n=1 Tax=Anaerostipes hadrus TaxID=649756 RepID=UPI001D067CBD
MRFALLFCLVTGLSFSAIHAQAKEMPNKEMYKKRMELYQHMEAFTQIPWYNLAAIDQYERSIRFV